MKSSTRTWLSHARTALLAAALVVLAWNLASFASAVNGREAFADALRGGAVPAEYRVGVFLAWVLLACLVEVVATWMGVVSFGTRGIARLQVGAVTLVAALSVAAMIALPVFGSDPSELHEVARRSLGTAASAGLPILWLGGLALFATQAAEASWPAEHGKVPALVGFLVGLAVFTLGLRALVPLSSGGPLLPG